MTLSAMAVVRTCLDVDPLSITMALHGAVCTVCGDGNVRGNEQCDDGTPQHYLWSNLLLSPSILSPR
jgi:hypothetical protein